jgi:hypothetical protein
MAKSSDHDHDPPTPESKGLGRRVPGSLLGMRFRARELPASDSVSRFPSGVIVVVVDHSPTTVRVRLVNEEYTISRDEFAVTFEPA